MRELMIDKKPISSGVDTWTKELTSALKGGKAVWPAWGTDSFKIIGEIGEAVLIGRRK